MRGFAILLVVVGHVLLNTFNIGGYSSVFSTIILTFRMPLFFFISGYLGYKVTSCFDVKNFVRKLKTKAIVQLIPTSIFFTIFMFSRETNPIDFLNEHGLGGFWFTIVLFEMFFCYYLLSLIGKFFGVKYVDIGLITLSFIGVFILIFYRGNGFVWNLLCVENLAKYFQFFTLGILIKKYWNVILKIVNIEISKIVIILSYIILLIILFDSSIKQNFPLVYKIVNNELVRYSGLMTVFIFFMTKDRFFKSTNKFCTFLKFVGRRTLDIYLIHYFLIPNLKGLLPWIESDSTFLLQMIFSVSIAFVIVICCLGISEIIRTSKILGYLFFGAK